MYEQYLFSLNEMYYGKHPYFKTLENLFDQFRDLLKEHSILQKDYMKELRKDLNEKEKQLKEKENFLNKKTEEVNNEYLLICEFPPFLKIEKNMNLISIMKKIVRNLV